MKRTPFVIVCAALLAMNACGDDAVGDDPNNRTLSECPATGRPIDRTRCEPVGMLCYYGQSDRLLFSCQTGDCEGAPPRCASVLTECTAFGFAYIPTSPCSTDAGDQDAM